MAKKNSSKPTPDFHKIFLLAEQYSEASLLLEKNAEDDEGKWSMPRLLVDSFAVELYLKCLYVLDLNSAPWGHDWKQLFDALKDYTKTAIRAEFKRIVKSDPVLSNLKVINPDAPDFTDFDLSLEVAKNTFDKGRYTYEPELPNDWFYAHLMRDAIRNVAAMIVPIEEAKRNQKKTT